MHMYNGKLWFFCDATHEEKIADLQRISFETRRCNWKNKMIVHLRNLMVHLIANNFSVIVYSITLIWNYPAAFFPLIIYDGSHFYSAIDSFSS